MSQYPYYHNWQYGYTLGPPAQSARGNYTMHYNQPAPPGVAPDSSGYQNVVPDFKPPLPPPKRPMKKPNPKAMAATTPSAPSNWGEVKALNPTPPKFVPKVFVTASPTTPTNSASPQVSLANTPADFIGPVKPSDPSGSYHNPCGQIHDLATFNNLVVVYETKEEVSNDKNFQVTLRLGGEAYVGTGQSIKAAKQNAAIQALCNTSLSKKMTMKPRSSSSTPTSELYELSQRKGVKVEFKFLEPYNFTYDKNAKNTWSKDEMQGNFKVQLDVAGRTFFGNADFPQPAKHNAAIEAIPYLHSLPDVMSKKMQQMPWKPTQQQQSEPQNNPTPVPGDMMQKNPIMYLNELGMSHGITVTWTEFMTEGSLNSKTYSWKIKYGDYEAVGSASNKKTAKFMAAQNLLLSLPPELSTPLVKTKKRSGGATKRKFQPTGVPNAPQPQVAPIVGPSEAKVAKKEKSLSGTLIHDAIKATNPISALFEYCKKGKLPEPDFQCVSANVLESWMKAGKTFKKIEYTQRVEIQGKTYFASSNTKKGAKTAVATEAWNYIRAQTFE